MVLLGIPLQALACSALLALCFGPWAGGASRQATGVAEAPAELRVRIEFAAEAGLELGLSQLAQRLDEQPAPLIVRFPRPAAAEAPVAEPDRIEVQLVGGERLVGSIGGGEGETLVLELVGGTPLPLEIDALLALRFTERLPDEPASSVEAAAEGDRLYRRVGARLDRIDGLVEGFSAAGVAFESLVGRQVVPWDELAALFIEPLSEPEPEPLDPRAVTLDLVDGTRLDARLLSSSARALVFEVRGGARLELEPAVLLRLTARGPACAYLSSRAPDEFRGGSAFDDELGLVFRPSLDAAVHGEPLVAGRVRQARGIGVQAPTELLYRLDPAAGWRVLRGAVAVDSSVLELGLEGSVKFRVSVDGELAWESPRLSASSGVFEWPEIPVAGAAELRLEVDMLDDLNVGDRADWLDVRLVN